MYNEFKELNYIIVQFPFQETCRIRRAHYIIVSEYEDANWFLETLPFS